MATEKSDRKRIEQYDHQGKERVNNPPVGLVTPELDREGGKKTYAFDPHLDPQLQWAGKAEHTSFAVPAVSLHVHERIDPRTIIEAVRKKNGANSEPTYEQLSLFGLPAENPPLREAIEFYSHKHNWSNRLVAGDSLLVMNSLLEKEGLAGQVQMVYLDPPYGIKYGSNFQPFVNKRDVKDGRDEDLTAEPEMVKAFRDTWEMGLHSYLTYLRDRLLLAKELLTDSGSIFVQISDENVHHVREVLDEVFEQGNFVSQIVFRKKQMPLGAKYIESTCDFILWYSRDISRVKFHQLFREMDVEGDPHWNLIELPGGVLRQMSKEELNNHKLLPPNAKIFTLLPLYPAGFNDTGLFPVTFEGKVFCPPEGKSWKTSPHGMNNLIDAKRIRQFEDGDTLRFAAYLECYDSDGIGISPQTDYTIRERRRT